MFKRIFPKFRFTDNTFINGEHRQPLSFRDAVASLQARIAESFSSAGPDKASSEPKQKLSEESVMAVITHTRLQSMLANTPSGGTTFTYKSKASQTYYNLPVLKAPANVTYLK
jgi:hypothetical protein